MKLEKPEDEKYFKDITLNTILEEISKENKTDIKKEAKEESLVKIYIQIFFFGIMPAILLLIFFMPIQTNTKTAQTKRVSSATKHNTAQPKTEHRQTSYTSKNETAKKIDFKDIKINPIRKKGFTEQEREKAKKALLQQMKTL